MVTIAERTRLMTAEEFAGLPEIPGKRFELVQGEVVEVSGPNALHGIVLNAVLIFLNGIAGIQQRGLVLPEVAFLLGRGPDLVRVPDASFVLHSRIPDQALLSSQWELAPDLVIEVVSPNDLATDVEAKVQEYLAAGTREVWVLWPTVKRLTVTLPDGTARTLGPDDELTTPDFLPIASIRVAELFPSYQPAPPQPGRHPEGQSDGHDR